MVKKKNSKVSDKLFQKKVRWLLIFFIFLVLFSLLTILFFTFHAFNQVHIIQKVPFTINVSNYVGFNLDTDMLHFGGVVPGGYAARNIMINSDFEGYVFVSSQEVDWVFVQNQGLAIKPDSSLSLKFMAKPPKDIKLQNVSGNFHVYIMKSDKTWPFIFFKENLLDSFEQVQDTGSKISITVND